MPRSRGRPPARNWSHFDGDECTVRTEFQSRRSASMPNFGRNRVKATTAQRRVERASLDHPMGGRLTLHHKLLRCCRTDARKKTPILEVNGVGTVGLQV